MELFKGTGSLNAQLIGSLNVFYGTVTKLSNYVEYAKLYYLKTS